MAWNLSEAVCILCGLKSSRQRSGSHRALGQELGYTQTNGTAELRAAIASMYPGAGPDHIEVTNGGSEANCIALWHLLEPGDEVVMMLPNYMQMRGLARGLGAIVRAWPLVEDETKWRADLEALDALVSPATKLILICNQTIPRARVSRLS